MPTSYLPPAAIGRPNLHLPIHAVRASDSDGGRPADIDAAQVQTWLDRANRVFAAAGVAFSWDGTFESLESTAVNSLEGDEDARWKVAKKTLNDIAIATRKVVVVFRHGADPDPARPTGGGFSWWTYDWVAMPGFDHTGVCGTQNIGLLGHELGHYLGLAHTFHGNPNTRRAFETISEMAAWWATQGQQLSAFDADAAIVDDTGPDPFVRERDCSTDMTVTVAGTTIPVLRGNLMSYWFHTGTSTLTTDQVRRVREMVEARRDGFGLDVRYEWHPDDEFGVYDRAYPDFRSTYDEAWPKGWRLSILRVHRGAVDDRYSAVWRPGTHPEIQLYGAAYDRYRARYDELWPQGWRLEQLRVHSDGATPRYSAVWTRGTAPEVQVYGVSYGQYRAKYDELWSQGWRLHQLAPHVVAGSVRYSVVWRRASSGEFQLHGVPYATYRQRYDELWPEGWRLHLLEQYVVDGQVRYDAVWRPSKQDEVQRYDATFEAFRARYDELWPHGWRLHLLTSYRLGANTRYSAVWRR